VAFPLLAFPFPMTNQIVGGNIWLPMIGYCEGKGKVNATFYPPSVLAFIAAKLLDANIKHQLRPLQHFKAAV
jgi:hypothetical protein